MSFRLPRQAWPLITVGLLVLVVGVMFQGLQNPISVDDGLRHFVMGQAWWSGRASGTAWQAYFSSGYLSQHVVDPWFLSNVLLGALAPLGLNGALLTYSLLLFLATLLIMLAGLRTVRTPLMTQCLLLPWLFALQPNFLYRVLLPRPYTLITVLSLAVLVSVLRRKIWWIAPLLFVAVLASQLFVFPALFVVAGVVWLTVLRERRLASQLALAGLMGIVAGFVCHPTGAAYWQYSLEVFLRIPFLSAQVGPSGEMQSEVLFSPFVLLAVILLSVGIVRIRQSARWPRAVQEGLPLLFGLTAVFFLLFLRFGRAIDFLWPLCILTLGAVLAHADPGQWSAAWRRRAVLGSVLLCLISGLNVLGISGRLRATDADRDLSAVARTLQAVPPGARVLNPDWQFFAPALAVRSDVRYVAGIDPVFTFLVDPAGHRYLRQMPADDPHDVAAWLEGLRAAFPGDFLILLRALHADTVRQLEQQGYRNLSADPLAATFDLRAAQ